MFHRCGVRVRALDLVGGHPRMLDARVRIGPLWIGGRRLALRDRGLSVGRVVPVGSYMWCDVRDCSHGFTVRRRTPHRLFADEHNHAARSRSNAARGSQRSSTTPQAHVRDTEGDTRSRVPNRRSCAVDSGSHLPHPAPASALRLTPLAHRFGVPQHSPTGIEQRAMFAGHHMSVGHVD
jgi:hypothetical protein